MSGGIEVAGQFAQLARPALGVGVVLLAADVLWQLGETGLDHSQPRARTDRFERELDIGTARIVLGQPVDLPGEPEHRRLLHPFHAHADREPVGPPHPGRPARTQVDRRLVAEPGPARVSRRGVEVHGPLDAIRKTHDGLQQVAIERLPYYGNRLVASMVLLEPGDGQPAPGQATQPVARAAALMAGTLWAT